MARSAVLAPKSSCELFSLIILSNQASLKVYCGGNESGRGVSGKGPSRWGGALLDLSLTHLREALKPDGPGLVTEVSQVPMWV